jgi:endo-alpha-1,4-polygalactosaminidase (GH114 family)
MASAVAARPVADSVRKAHVPPRGVPWQYQLQASPSGRFAATGGIDLRLCVPSGGGKCVRPRIFDIDLYGPGGTVPNSRAVAAIRHAGEYAICYVDAGTWESWRPDARRFPRSVLGRPNGWPGERWLDIRRLRVLIPIMAARVARCAQAGFQAVEFDNVDGYSNHTGFPLTFADQIRYNEALARLAHRAGLAVGLKNDYGQVRVLWRWFDFAIDEQCVQYGECHRLRPFLAAGKPVFDVEYSISPARFCPRATAAGVDAIAKRPSLFARPWVPCR